MRAVIIDDEDSVRETTRTLVNIYASDIEIVEEANSVSSGYEAISRVMPDLVFLDVEMPDGTGFDLLSKFDNPTFHIIFITGHNAYAIEAFRYSAIDYLLKPLDPEDLINSIGKARQKIDENLNKLKLQAFLTNISQGSGSPKKIILSDSESVYLIETSEIIRCQAEGNYTRFYINGDQEILVSKTLKEYDNLFSSKDFFRAHQSHLINLQHFLRYDKKEGGILVMKNGDTIPVAVRKKDSLFEALKNISWG